jgi:hypothetical protein
MLVGDRGRHRSFQQSRVIYRCGARRFTGLNGRRHDVVASTL